METRLKVRLSMYAMAAASVVVAMASVRFLFLKLEVAAPGLAVHAGFRDVAFYLHVGAASVALLVGPWQFFKSFRNRHPLIHRAFGGTYLLACVLGGVSGIYIGFYSPNGPVAAAGFMLLGALWVVATCMGGASIYQGNIARHRRWMTRSFAMAFAAVTLRLYLPPFFMAGVDPVIIFGIVAWISWLPNLFIAERYLIPR